MTRVRVYFARDEKDFSHTQQSWAARLDTVGTGYTLTQRANANTGYITQSLCIFLDERHGRNVRHIIVFVHGLATRPETSASIPTGTQDPIIALEAGLDY